jgi:succinyl-CoA synthetase alpha subunit
MMMLLILSLALTGCGIGGDDEEDATVSIEDAETCEEVAEYFAGVAQDFINDAEDAGMIALAAGMESEVVQEYLPQVEMTQQKVQELGCSEEEMRPLLEERIDELETDGPVGEFIIQLLRDQGIGQ